MAITTSGTPPTGGVDQHPSPTSGPLPHGGPDAAGAPPRPPTLDIVVPVLDEAHVLAASIGQLYAHLDSHMPFTWRITIADNGSTDGTVAVAQRLAVALDRVRVIHLDERGRGRALRAAWSSSDAEVVAYTDVDLSTGLDALLPLVAPLVSGHSDLAIGSRLASGASVARGPRREAISRSYNLILRVCFATRFRDAQCGFKAARRDAIDALLPEVRDENWFFDTELLLLAEHNGLRVLEVPVDWIDDPDSRVDVVRTALADLRGLMRMARRFVGGGGFIAADAVPRHDVGDNMGRQLVVFAAIGAVCTTISAAVYLGVRSATGAVVASLLALTVTAAANTWANRRFTFRRRGPAGRRTDLLRSAAVFAGGAALSAAAVVTVGRLGGGTVAELVALCGVWAVVAVARFFLLRHPAHPDPKRTRSGAPTP